MNKLDIFTAAKVKHTFDLDQPDAQGGQAKVFFKNGLVYKIYHDPKGSLPPKRIKELSVITNPNVYKPIEQVFDKNGKAVGHTTKYIKDCHVLCKIFTGDFRKEHNLKHDSILKLVQQFHDMVEEVHSHKILMVDLNEFNFLLNEDLDQFMAIDTDTWQTPSFKDTAIMDSVRDFHTPLNVFSELTDWFSFAVTSFQMLVYAHPYANGTVDSIKHVKRIDQMVYRMKNNISAFDTAKVRLPKICFPVNDLPETYKSWCKSILQDGKRTIPPKDLFSVAVIPTSTQPSVVYLGSNQLEIKKIFRCNSEIFNYFYDGTNELILTTDGFGNTSDPHTNAKVNLNTKVIFAPKSKHSISAIVNDGKLQLTDLTTQQPIKCDLAASSLMEYSGRLYIKSGASISQVEINELPNLNVLIIPRVVAQCSQASTSVFHGGLLTQTMLGKFAVTVFPAPNRSQQIFIKELDSYRVMAAKFDSGVAVIVGVKNGRYDRFVIRFNDNYSEYDCIATNDIIFSNINFVTLDSGVCVLLNEEEKLEIFKAKKDSLQMKIIDDPNYLSGEMKLFRKGLDLLFSKENILYSLKMK